MADLSQKETLKASIREELKTVFNKGTIEAIIGLFDIDDNKKVYQELEDSAELVLDVTKGENAKLILSDDTELTFENLFNGAEGNIIVVQGSEDYTLDILPIPYVIDDGAGVIELSSGVGFITILSYTYDGTNLYVTIGSNYTNS